MTLEFGRGTQMDARIEVRDALEILKSLVGLQPIVIRRHGSRESMAAAIAVPESVTVRELVSVLRQVAGLHRPRDRRFVR
jgi:fatty acid/phospholipid biosynthesis enzyme